MIRLDRVSFTYPGASAPALHEVTVELGRDGVTLVTGPLGSGCSTLLLLAAGLAPHLTGGTLSGTVKTLEVELGTRDAHRALAGRVGLLLPTPWTQLSGISYTAWDEVAFGPANLGWPRDRIAAAVERAMELTGVAHLRNRDPATLSGGELQRVILAGIIALEPAVFLFDEPAIELDPAAADRFYQVAHTLSRSALVVIATTEVDRAASAAGRVLLLSRGRLVASGTPDHVLGSPAAIESGCAPSTAILAHRAGLQPPYPTALDHLAARMSR